MNITTLIEYVMVVLLLAVVIIGVFPQVLEYAKKPLSQINYADLSVSEQNALSGTFEQFAKKLEDCKNNGKSKCLCANVIPNYPIVFESKYKAVAKIKLEPAQTKTYVSLTFNDRDIGLKKELNGILYVIDKTGNELEFNPKVWIFPKWMTSWQTGEVNLKLEKKEINFKKAPKLVIITKDYGNPEVNLASASIYKYSENILELMSGEFKADFC